jgi:3-hydroxybutyryl-CoA dehydrogenase
MSSATQTTAPETVAVVGAGQMCRGIAQVAAAAGYRVLLYDLAPSFAEAGKQALERSLEKLVQKGRLTPKEQAAQLQRIEPVAELRAVAVAQYVIEAVSEQEAIKRDLFTKLDAQALPETILASNTSSISITRLAAASRRPEHFIGLHFMNPVPVMKLVEIVCGVATSPATLQRARAFAESLGKQVVVSQDHPGFVVNRVLMPMINEAIFALMEGVASATDIDLAMVLGTHQPMGPLALADFIGLDTCLAILEVLHRDLGDPKYRPCPLLRRLVHAGRLGRKSHQGFFPYP